MVLNDALMLMILRYAEENANGDRPIQEPSFTDYDRQQVLYHIDMCRQAGFLKVHESGKRLKILALTWSGHQKLQKCADG